MDPLEDRRWHGRLMEQGRATTGTITTESVRVVSGVLAEVLKGGS
jgi:hypothetical protein